MNGLTSMLSNLWDSANGSAIQASEGLDMELLFRESAELVFRADEAIQFSLTSEPGLPSFAADPQKIAHMIRILLQEAKSNIKGEGNVEVHISHGIDESSGQNLIRVSCIDDGKPIGEGDLSRLFDPFYVRPHQPEEYGTNLMACYLTVYHHGGTIEAERLHEEGRNALTFEIPVSSTPCLDREGSRNIIDQSVKMKATSRIALSS